MQLRLDPALCADSSTASKLLINISNRVDQLQKNFTLNFDALFLSFVQGQARRREWCWGRRASLGGYASTIIPSTEWDSFLFFAFLPAISQHESSNNERRWEWVSRGASERKDQKSKIIDFPKHWKADVEGYVWVFMGITSRWIRVVWRCLCQCQGRLYL